MNHIFIFIKDRFLTMPSWVQISTYLSFVVLFIYLFTAPRFLDMRLVSNDYGDEFPIGGAQVEIEIEGRVLILLTDTRGRFSVPVSTNYPLGSYLFILSPDPASNKIKEIKVPVSNSYLNRSKIIYNKKNHDYQIIPNGVIENSKKLLASLNPISSAYADDHSIALDTNIAQEILASLEIITKIPFKKTPEKMLLRDDLEIDNIDLSYINNRLNKKFGIDCLRDFQRKAETVEDLIRIAQVAYEKKNNLKMRTVIQHHASIIKDKIFSTPMMAKYKLGRIFRKSGQYTSAIKLLKEVIEDQPSFYQAWFDLAQSYDAIGDLEKAELAFKTTLKLESNTAEFFNTYAMFLLKQNRSQEALEQFEKEKTLKPYQ